MDPAAWRDAMVCEQIEARGISDPRVLAALRAVPRHPFVPQVALAQAHGDHALPLPIRQTLSQPYIVALMAEALELKATDRVLDVGSGSGYAAAVLAHLCQEVHGVERLPDLVAQAEVDLRGLHLANLHLANLHLHVGDGSRGWPEAAPFDAIHVACATAEVPPALVDQLAEGGRMVLPLGPPFNTQWLVRVRKRGGRITQERLLAVAFVPMVGEG